jgi:hypothetical protein
VSQCAIGGNIRLETFTTPPPTKFGGAFFNARRGGRRYLVANAYSKMTNSHRILDRHLGGRVFHFKDK